MKPELHQPVVEIATEVCRDIQEARRDVVATRSHIARLAREHGLRIAAAGTHPFSHWAAVGITGGNPRYDRLVEELQMVARANLIFGLHVHVGVEDKEARIRIMNQARYSCRASGAGRELALLAQPRHRLDLYRCKVFDRFRAPTCRTFLRTVSSGVRNLLVKTGCVIDGRQIWWTCRASCIRVEYRICISRCGPRRPSRLRRCCRP
jgi:carboxylate-amine ligase